MHRCLLVDELVGLICSHLGPEDDKATLINFSLTTKKFTDHALDVLWKRLSGPEDFLHIMPIDMWEIEIETHFDEELGDELSLGQDKFDYSIINPARELRPEDWNRFDFYAKRVKEWEPEFNTEECLHFSEESWEEIDSSRCGKCLFPRLEYITFMVHTPYLGEALPFIGKLLLSPAITSVTVQNSIGSTNSLYVGSLLDTIHQHCPSIQAVKAQGSGMGSEESDFLVDFSRFLCQIPNLRRLELENAPITNDAIEYIGDLPHFDTLMLESIDAKTMSFFSSANGRFQKLAHIAAISGGRTICYLLRSLHPPLHTLSIILERDDWQFGGKELSIQDVTQALVTNSFLRSSLRHLSISGSSMHTQEANSDGHKFPYLHDLFPLEGLRELHLQMNPFGPISSTWLSSLSKYWPKMHSFELSYWLAAIDEDSVSWPTLESVVSLALGWDDLEELGVTCIWEPFDVSALKRATGNKVHSKVTRIKRCSSRFSRDIDGVDDSEEYLQSIITCLLEVFPNLMEIGLEFGPPHDWQSLSRLLRDRKKVEESTFV